MTVKQDRGVTLIELMIVLVIAAILAGGIYALFTAQQRSYYVQDRVAGIQQDARAALSIMAKEIRMAGFSTGTGGGSGFSSVGTYNYALNPVNGGSDNPDEITIVLATDSFATIQSITGQIVTLSAGSVEPGDLISFADDKQVYSVLTINNPNAGDIKLNDIPPDHLVTIGASAYRVDAITYRINGDSLERNGADLAGDGTTTVVEDLQFAYQIAGDDTWYGSDSGFPTGLTESDIRLVRISLVVRTAVEDPEDQSYSRPAIEDRAGSGTQDGYRRRVYTTVVKLRNF